MFRADYLFDKVNSFLSQKKQTSTQLDDISIYYVIKMAIENDLNAALSLSLVNKEWSNLVNIASCDLMVDFYGSEKKDEMLRKESTHSSTAVFIKSMQREYRNQSQSELAYLIDRSVGLPEPRVTCDFRRPPMWKQLTNFLTEQFSGPEKPSLLASNYHRLKIEREKLAELESVFGRGM